MGNIQSKLIMESNQIYNLKKASDVNIVNFEQSAETELENIISVQERFGTHMLDFIQNKVDETLSREAEFLEIKRKVNSIIPLNPVDLNQSMNSMVGYEKYLQDCLNHYHKIYDMKKLDCYNMSVESLSAYLSSLNSEQIDFIITTINDNPLFFLYSFEGHLLVKMSVIPFLKCCIYFSDTQSNSFKIFIKDSLELNKPSLNYFYKPIEISYQTIKKYKYTIASSSTLISVFYMYNPWFKTHQYISLTDSIDKIPVGKPLGGSVGEIIKKAGNLISECAYSAGLFIAKPIGSFMHGVFDAKRDVIKGAAEIIDNRKK